MSESEFLNSNVHTPHPHSAKPQQAPQQRKFHQRGFEENATVCACVVRRACRGFVAEGMNGERKQGRHKA